MSYDYEYRKIDAGSASAATEEINSVAKRGYRVVSFNRNPNSVVVDVLFERLKDDGAWLDTGGIPS